MTLKYIWRSFSLICHFHVHFSYPWHAFASHRLPAIAELLVLLDTIHCFRIPGEIILWGFILKLWWAAMCSKRSRRPREYQTDTEMKCYTIYMPGVFLLQISVVLTDNVHSIGDQSSCRSKVYYTLCQLQIIFRLTVHTVHKASEGMRSQVHGIIDTNFSSGVCDRHMQWPWHVHASSPTNRPATWVHERCMFMYTRTHKLGVLGHGYLDNAHL